MVMASSMGIEVALTGEPSKKALDDYTSTLSKAVLQSGFNGHLMERTGDNTLGLYLFNKLMVTSFSQSSGRVVGAIILVP